jgi:glycyl-tRNA synthetase beta subunit
VAEIAPLVGADVEKAKRDGASLGRKPDLLTEVVGEFPETARLDGEKYYAAGAGRDATVAAASEDT